MAEEKKELGKHPVHHESHVHHEHHEEHHEAKIDNNPDSIKFSNVKKNPWMIASVILGIAVIILLVMTLSGTGIAGKTVSKDAAGNNVINFAKAQGLDAKVLGIMDKGAFYEVNLSMNNQEFPVYVTKDGENMATGLIPLSAKANANTNPNTNTNANNQPAAADVPKSDKPKAEAFIFSYCPYGLQFEKALFPVYDLLKNKADIDIVAIGAMHGEFEKTETLRQISIEKLYSRDKLFSYLKEFDVNNDLGNCRGEETCSGKYLPAIYTKLGIDKVKVDAYMKSNAEKIYNEQGASASKLGIGGSPTFVINGVQVQVNRSPDSIKEAICNAFNTKPSECSQKLSTASASAGFGASTGSAASANSAAGCAPA